MAFLGFATSFSVGSRLFNYVVYCVKCGEGEGGGGYFVLSFLNICVHV